MKAGRGVDHSLRGDGSSGTVPSVTQQHRATSPQDVLPLIVWALVMGQDLTPQLGPSFWGDCLLAHRGDGRAGPLVIMCLDGFGPGSLILI